VCSSDLDRVRGTGAAGRIRAFPATKGLEIPSLDTT